MTEQEKTSAVVEETREAKKGRHATDSGSVLRYRCQSRIIFPVREYVDVHILAEYAALGRQ